MLAEMLARIHYPGPIAADATTVTALHRAWRRAVPYENLDIQLGRPIRLDEDALFDKIVRRGRGGYCYEQNGALAMLLRAAGFSVTMVEGAVMRAQRGEKMWGNHTVLLVDIDNQTWIADAGIGDGFLDPLPLWEGSHVQGRLRYRLEHLDADTWRFHHHERGTIASYDFRTEPRELDDFAERSDELSTSSQSSYVTTLIAGRPVAGHTAVLLSRTLRRLGADDLAPTRITSLAEFGTVLSETFRVPLADLGDDDIELLWEKTGTQDDLWRARVESDRA